MGGLRKFTDEGEMVPALEKLTVHWEKQIDTLIIVTKGIWQNLRFYWQHSILHNMEIK